MINFLTNTYINNTGANAFIEFDSNGRRRSMLLKKGEIFSASFHNAENISVNGKPLLSSGIRDISSIIHRAAILDLETQGKVGGSIITEASLFRNDQNVVDVFFTKPYFMVKYEGKDLESLGISQKKARRGITVKTKAAPRSHQAAFLTKHLMEMLSDKQRSYELFEHIAPYRRADLASITLAAAKVSSGITFDKLQLAETILSADQKHAFLEIPELRDYILRQAAVTDPFQTRYYVKDAEEARRLGLTRHLFGSKSDREIHKYFRYLRDADALKGKGLAEMQTQLENIFKDRYSVSNIDINVREVSIEDLIQRRLPDLIEGRSIQASYSIFESMQIGASIRGMLSRDLIDEGMDVSEITPEVIERELRARGNPFERVVKGVSYTGDPFYTTGYEYRLQKALSLKHNKFADLLTPYLSTTGAGSARDIIDLQKINQALVHDLGIANIPKSQAMAVEIQSRLFGAAQKISEGASTEDILSQIAEKEAHISASDAAISSRKIFESSLSFAVAGQEFKKGTALGMHLYEEALEGRGPLLGLFAYGKLSQAFATTASPEDLGLMDILLEGRIARNLQSVVDKDDLRTFQSVTGYKFIDIPQTMIEDGKRVVTSQKEAYAITTSYSGIQGIYEDARNIQKDYAGSNADEAIKRLFGKLKTKDGRLLLDYDEITGEYSLPQRPTMPIREGLSADQYTIAQSQYETDFSSYQARMSQLRSKVASQVESNLAQIELFDRRAESIVKDIIPNVQESLKRATTLDGSRRIPNIVISSRGSMERALGAHETIKAAKRIALPVMGFGLAMSGLSTLEAFQQPERSSYLIPSYEQWFTAQAEMFGSEQDFIREMQARQGYITGMRESGLASTLRKYSSDFGSPYTGPGYSSQTLEQNELLRERQKLLRNRYTVQHLTGEGNIGLMLSAFIRGPSNHPMNSSFKQSYLLNSGSVGAEPYRTFKGRDLTRVNVTGNYKIDVQDADTITLKRNFSRSGFRDFFFGRKSSESMSIRLAGIDAPETAHQNRGAQPYAEAAKRIAQDMISKAKNVQVVFDDTDATYGRRVGVVYADGVNVNLELIKRGAAAYLPYRSNRKQTIYNEREFEAAQSSAYKSKRGMWRSDFFRAYREMSATTGQTVTFNSLVNTKKVATNTSLMTMYSTMRTAEAFGMQHTESQMAIAESALILGSRSGSGNIFRPDFESNEWTDPSLVALSPNNSVLTGMDELKYDLKRLTSTRGGNKDQKHATANTRHLNAELASDLKSPRHNAFNGDYGFRPTEYNKRFNRMKMMEALQQRETQRMFKYSSGHHRM